MLKLNTFKIQDKDLMKNEYKLKAIYEYICRYFKDFELVITIDDFVLLGMNLILKFPNLGIKTNCGPVENIFFGIYMNKRIIYHLLEKILES